MTTLNEFLMARIAEDEDVARGAMESTGGRKWESEKFYDDLYGVDLRTVWEESFVYMPDEMYESEAQKYTGLQVYISNHVARFDPARILAEVAAKRAVMKAHAVVKTDLHRNVMDGRLVKAYIETIVWCAGCDHDYDRDWYTPAEECETLRALAAIYKDHPDYNPDWSIS